MLRRIAAGVIAAITLAGASIAGPFEDGSAAYERGDHATALQLWIPLAEQNDAGSQHMIGVFYEKGYAVSQDLAKAADWYRAAAEQGYGLSQYHLGGLYWEGKGVAQDRVHAYMWMLLAFDGTDSDVAVKAEKTLSEWDAAISPEEIAAAEWIATGWIARPEQ